MCSTCLIKIVVLVDIIHYGEGLCGLESYRVEVEETMEKCLDLCKNDRMCTYVSFGGSNSKPCWLYNDLRCDLNGLNDLEGFETYKKVITGISHFCMKFLEC